MVYSDYDDFNQGCSLKLKYTVRGLYTLSISLRMEVKQCVIIKFLRFKGMKLVDIHHELTKVFGEEAYARTHVRTYARTHVQE
jgi:hypothetical protein